MGLSEEEKQDKINMHKNFIKKFAKESNEIEEEIQKLKMRQCLIEENINSHKACLYDLIYEGGV